MISIYLMLSLLIVIIIIIYYKKQKKIEKFYYHYHPSNCIQNVFGNIHCYRYPPYYLHFPYYSYLL